MQLKDIFLQIEKILILRNIFKIKFKNNKNNNNLIYINKDYLHYLNI